jgi:hypothetical protein
MKKTNFALLSVMLFCGLQADTHAQTMKLPQHKKITLSKYLFNSADRILNMENLTECLGRSIEIRILTSDCNAFLDDLDLETREVHSNAQAAYLRMNHAKAQSRAMLFLDLYSDMISTISTLKSKSQNKIDKQSVVYSIRQQVLMTRKKMVKLFDHLN